MMSGRLTYVLIALLCTLVGSAEAHSLWPLDLIPKPGADAVSAAPHQDADARVGPCVSGKAAIAPDDEVEVPDESEDDRPDDRGSAIYQKSRSSQILPISIDAILTGSVPLAPPARGNSGHARLDRPRFLSLCRLLF